MLKCYNPLKKLFYSACLTFEIVQGPLIQNEYARKNIFPNLMYNSFIFLLKYMDMEIIIQVEKKISPQERITDWK